MSGRTARLLVILAPVVLARADEVIQ